MGKPSYKSIVIECQKSSERKEYSPVLGRHVRYGYETQSMPNVMPVLAVSRPKSVGPGQGQFFSHKSRGPMRGRRVETVSQPTFDSIVRSDD